MKRALSLAALLLVIAMVCSRHLAIAQQNPAAVPATSGGANLAIVATPSTSYVSGDQNITAINDGYDPRNSRDARNGAYGNWPRNGTQWVQLDWSQPISTNKIDVYWYVDGAGIHLPKEARVKYWDGKAFLAVSEATGPGVLANQYNTTTFSEVTTTKLRLEFDAPGVGQSASTGILECKVYDSGKSPKLPPIVKAGIERVVVLPGKTFLHGTVKTVNSDAASGAKWSKVTGPGEVSFEDAGAAITTAQFSQPGEYVLQLSAGQGPLAAADTLHVRVDPPAPTFHLDPVDTKPYTISSTLWNGRLKSLIVNWIPHCCDEISNLNLREGGINNFIQAANKMAGKPYTRHVGYPFSNAWVHNTVEAMSVALMVDPQGDADIIRAQAAMRAKLDEWIPIILAAQEPDGYLQTLYTISGRQRWTVKGDHEGYTGGYFIESAIAHYQLTGRKDARLYNAARKLADCWYDNLGPAPKKYWYDGHEEMEQALVRLSRLVDEVDGPGKGRKYVELAKFLIDSRKGGQDYDQSKVPATQQYEAVGHAVRAVYLYSGMTDIAMQTGDADYQSAVMSLWNNLVNQKMYLTGGVGSGETSEGFGPGYSLRNNSAYCESCSNCGELFFQYKMNLSYQDSRYVDLYEDTFYNAILGDLDQAGQTFNYTNPLDSRGGRTAWHVCPCCVGNIARTILMLPTWMYAKGPDSIYVNLFIGSTVNVENIAGTNVQMVQATDYPWSGNIAITVNPTESKNFTVKVRVPSHDVSTLYSSTPASNGIISLAVNGVAMTPTIDKGYAVITRQWKAGDKIDLVLPMNVQRIKAIDNVAADRGRVALRRGPLIYNIESVDQNLDLVLKSDAPLTTEFQPDIVGGLMAIRGKYADGSPLLAIPNYARNNRGGRSIVWLKDQ